MKTVYGLLAWILCSITPVIAQQKFHITGKVMDEKGKPMPFASVFLNQTTIGDRTTEQGNFNIQQVPPGKYELIVSYLGYEPILIPVTVDKDLSGIVVNIRPKVGQLKEFVVKRNAERDAWMRVFKETFLGMSDNAKQCTILNDEVIDLQYDRQMNKLSASAEDFIIIENKALGYRIRFLLISYENNFRSGHCMYYGNPLFEIMKARNNTQEKRWVKAREKAYYGSSMQFFRSLVAGTLREDGYEVRKLVRKNRGDDFVPSDSLGGTPKIQKPGMFSRTVSYLYTTILPYDSIMHKTDSGYALAFHDLLYITYTKEKEGTDYMKFSNYARDIKAGHQQSIVSLLEPQAAIDVSGTLAEPMNILYEQYWGFEKMAEMLPLNYKR